MTDGAKMRVMIVDDTSANVRLLVEILKQDYTTVTAQDGEEALELLQNDPLPQIILLDVMMPGMDGFEVCALLKSEPRTQAIPVIFLTALTENSQEAKGLALGAVDYITKPISAPIVRARVRTHLALFDQNRALEELVAKRTQALRETQMALLDCLGRAAEYKDNETGTHTIRVSQYVKTLALAHGMKDPEASILATAAPMHDIGKIGIPDNILRKPGKLDAEEWTVMKQHPGIGAQILGTHDSELLQKARIIALTHHEKWDGSGYPRGLRGEEIPLEGRLVAVADVFDALTSERPYKKAWTVEAAAELIQQQRGAHFDPHLVDCFMKVLPAFRTIKESAGETLAAAS